MAQKARGKKKVGAKSSAETRSKGSKLPRPLEGAKVFAACPTSIFKSGDTKTIKPSHEIISQNRAVRAINMGLGIRKPGYNIYVAGMGGTGKTSVIRTFLERWSSDAETPSDWLYVYDFNTPETPRAIAMAHGEGRKFKKKMEALIKTLREEIPEALQSEDYENAVNASISLSNDKKTKLFSDLEKLAKTMEFQIKSTRMGIETIPVSDGRALTEKDYNKLDEKIRESIESRRGKLEPEVLDFARKVRAIEQETKETIESLRSALGQDLVARHLDSIVEKYDDNEKISEYLSEVRKDILENLLEFAAPEEEDGEETRQIIYEEERDHFRRYAVNVFVDNTNSKGAPVIIETNPTYYNLFGKIEKNVEHGMYLTDFTMIKAGAVQRANGGYLVLNAIDIFKVPSIWETMKRVLKNRMGFIEDMGEQYSIVPTSGLRPAPVPLDLKVILIGSDDIYHALFDLDEDFHKIFKIKADFDYKMERTQKNIDAYLSFVATRAHREKLLPFDKSAVASMVEFGSRLVEDQRLLSTQFGVLKDITIEADFIAREREATMVKREHVEAALDEKFYRVSLVEDHMLEMVSNKDILLDLHGSRIGQINGLAVYDMGDYSFGKLNRITCTTSISDDGIVNIERASKLSGNIHDKGLLILTGFINSVLAKRHRLGLSASICFEQSYGTIDGDSASCAELVAIISAMADITISQSFAMTGSVNQLGDIQPVGGINEKVEGFHKVAKLLGKGGPYSIIIPYQNAPNLMLHSEARKSVQEGLLRIYPVRHVSEAFELATNIPLGIHDVTDAKFAPGSALERIAKKIATLRAEERKHHRHKESEPDDEPDVHEDHAARRKATARKRVQRSI